MTRALVKGTRRPSARKLEPEFDEPPRCHYCKNDGSERCHCHGLGYDREQPSVILTIWRGFQSVEVQVIFSETGEVTDAYCVQTEGEFKNGESVELTLDEIAEAKEGLKR